MVLSDGGGRCGGAEDREGRRGCRGAISNGVIRGRLTGQLIWEQTPGRDEGAMG